MRIYDVEKRDGLSESLCGDNGLGVATITAKVKRASFSNFDKMIASLKDTSANMSTIEDLIGEDQPDLALIVSILASVGWNLNDDIFIPAELWAARGSAKHKPMNHMHNDSVILGHIVESHAIDKFGHKITLDENDSIPEEFDVEVAGVLYKALPARKDLIEDILSKANDGEMFVSMECWFPDFSYGFIDEDTGMTKIVERNESTAFLTKHLKIFNGTGEFQGNKVGRVLKDFVFGGQGFVSEPANPESVIKVAANKTAANKGFEEVALTDISKGGVDSMDQKEIEAIQNKLKDAEDKLEKSKAENSDIQTQLDEIKDKDLDTKVGALQAKVDELTDQVTEARSQTEAVQKEKVDLQKKLDETVSDADKSKAELEKIQKSITANERLAKLSEVRDIEDKEKTLADLAEMSDETFEIVVQYAGQVKSEKDADGSDDDEGGDANKGDAGSEAQANLNDVKAKDEADMNVAGDQESGDDENALALAHTLTGNRHKTDEGGE